MTGSVLMIGLAGLGSIAGLITAWYEITSPRLVPTRVALPLHFVGTAGWAWIGWHVTWSHPTATFCFVVAVISLVLAASHVIEWMLGHSGDGRHQLPR